jgi:hypothetical protein
MLRYTPEELKTAEMCLIAVKHNSHALKYVPEELKDEVQRTMNSEQ